MIVDLVRNDLGASCEPGTIGVDPLMAIETTPYCHQMVSGVRGPAGSERGRRRAAGGDVPLRVGHRRSQDRGHAHRRRAGGTDRAATTRARFSSRCPARWTPRSSSAPSSWTGQSFRYGTGGGITIDSDPREEWEESVLKTRPLLGQTPTVALRETCRLVGGRVPLWPYHRARLAAGGCGRGLLRCRGAVVLEAAAAWAGPIPAAVRLTVVRDARGRHRCPRRATSVLARRPGTGRSRAWTSPIAPVLPPGAAKPVDRAYWDDAQRRAKVSGGDIAVLVDADGLIVDGGTATVWIVDERQVVTPPAPPGGGRRGACVRARRARARGRAGAASSRCPRALRTRPTRSSSPTRSAGRRVCAGAARPGVRSRRRALRRTWRS